MFDIFSPFGLGWPDGMEEVMIKNGFEAGKHFDELIFSEKEENKIRCKACGNVFRTQ